MYDFSSFLVIYPKKLTIAVETLADLGCNVGQVKSLVHCILRVLAVGRRGHVATVISRSEVIRESCLVKIGYGVVLFEGRVSTADTFTGLQAFSCDVFCDPVGVTELTLVNVR